LGDEGQPDRKKNNVLARKRLLPTKSFHQHHTYFRFGLIGRELGIMSPYLPPPLSSTQKGGRTVVRNRDGRQSEFTFAGGHLGA
jgi:hypothetical protein